MAPVLQLNYISSEVVIQPKGAKLTSAPTDLL
jgi:hypothetical protein